MHRLLRFTLMVIIVAGLACVPAEAQEHRNIWSGIFNETQAERGEKAFVATCARCHLEDLSGRNGPALKGPRFIEDWREASLDILFSTIKTMPPNTARNPSPRLPESTSLDILTHILRVNGAPAGSQELTVESLAAIQFEKQSGPEAVPNLTLVRVMGCLTQSSATAWSIASAGEPVRAMDPEVMSPSDLNAAKVAMPGTNSYRLSQIDYIDKPIADFKDHTVLIKGTLVRADQGTRINLTALESVAKSCLP